MSMFDALDVCFRVHINCCSLKCLQDEGNGDQKLLPDCGLDPVKFRGRISQMFERFFQTSICYTE